MMIVCACAILLFDYFHHSGSTIRESADHCSLALLFSFHAFCLVWCWLYRCQDDIWWQHIGKLHARMAHNYRMEIALNRSEKEMQKRRRWWSQKKRKSCGRQVESVTENRPLLGRKEDELVVALNSCLASCVYPSRGESLALKPLSTPSTK